MPRTAPRRFRLISFGLPAAVVAAVLTVVAPGAAAGPSAAATTSVSIAGFEQLAVGTSHSCGIDDQADLYCWGRNDEGQLGNGTTDDALLPVPVTVTGTPLAGKDIADVVVGDETSCALATDDTLACWGSDSDGQLGNGADGPSELPTAVAVAGTPLDGADITDLDMLHLHVCALTSTGSIACWGLGSVGQLGNGVQADSDVPVAVATASSALDGKTVEQLAVGAFNTCALATDDTVACWGTRARGVIGDDGTGNYALSPTAATVTGTPLAGKDLIAITNARYTTCVSATDGTVACWGEAQFGQLGNDDTTDAPTAVTVTTAGTPLQGKVVDQLDAGFEHICAKTTDGTAACWGADRGIGHGSLDDAMVPTAPAWAGTVLDGVPIDQVATGWNRTCMLGTDGTPACWGTGPVGDGSYDTSTTPAEVVLSYTAPTTAPTITGLTPGVQEIQVEWSGPAGTGGVPVSSVIVRAYLNGSVDDSFETSTDPSGSGSVWISATPGIDYRFTVQATNVAGAGPESALSAPVQALPPGPDETAYTPITPCRIVDTRLAGGRFGDREIRDFQVTGSGEVFALQGGKADGCDIPFGVAAVEASITAVDPTDSGFFRAWPTGQSMPNATFMNFDRGMDITNTGSVTIATDAMINGQTNGGGAGELRARNFGGASHYVIDIQGYFGSERMRADRAAAVTSAEPAVALYSPITPCRIVDTRQAGGTLSNREIRDITVTGAGVGFAAQGGKAGGCDIPTDAVAVEASVTAVDPADSGFFRAWPTGQSMPNATFMNFDRGMDITNTGSLTINPDEPQHLRIRNFGGTSHYVIDIQGYYVDTLAASHGQATTSVVYGDSTYVAITPCRIVDTRQPGLPLIDRQIRDITVTGAGVGFAAQGGKAGGCDIPTDAVAVEASVTAVDPADSGFFRAWPTGQSMPNATFMNFDRGMDITNTGSLTINPDEPQHLRIRNFGGTSHYVIDIQGYFLPEDLD